MNGRALHMADQSAIYKKQSSNSTRDSGEQIYFVTGKRTSTQGRTNYLVIFEAFKVAEHSFQEPMPNSP